MLPIVALTTSDPSFDGGPPASTASFNQGIHDNTLTSPVKLDSGIREGEIMNSVKAAQSDVYYFWLSSRQEVIVGSLSHGEPEQHMRLISN